MRVVGIQRREPHRNSSKDDTDFDWALNAELVHVKPVGDNLRIFLTDNEGTQGIGLIVPKSTAQAIANLMLAVALPGAHEVTMAIAP